MAKKLKKNALEVDVGEQDLVLINESPENETGQHPLASRVEPSWEPKKMPRPEPERRDMSARVLTTKPEKVRSFRPVRVALPARPKFSRGFMILVVVGFFSGAWITKFYTYLTPLSRPAAARPQQSNGKGFPVYQAPGTGPRCLLELDTAPTATQVRMNRVWSGGLTPTVLSLPCQKTVLLTLTTKAGLVSHERFKPTKTLDARKLSISKSALTRAATWLALVSDFHSQLFQKH